MQHWRIVQVGTHINVAQQADKATPQSTLSNLLLSDLHYLGGHLWQHWGPYFPNFNPVISKSKDPSVL